MEISFEGDVSTFTSLETKGINNTALHLNLEVLLLLIYLKL